METIKSGLSSEPSWVTTSFALFEASLNGEKKTSIHGLRGRALQKFLSLGFPTTELEEWRYTNVSPIARTPFGSPQHRDVTRAEVKAEVKALYGAELPVQRAVFLNGQYLAALSALPQSISVISLADVLKSHDANDARYAFVSEYLGRCAEMEEAAFTSLNTTFTQNGVALDIPKGVVVKEPLHLIFLSEGATPFATHPRILVRAQEGSEVTVVESYIGKGDTYLTNTVTEISVEERALVHHVKIQRESKNAFHVGALYAKVNKLGVLRTHVYSFGGRICRNEVRPVLGGEGINCSLHGLTVIGGEQQVDNQTVLDHAKPRSESIELYKGIYSGKATGVFNGTIIVRQDAQKTNAIQSNQTLLLSDDATINARPQLKIWADDVKCTHGATVGQLDENALFYLRSRGIPVSEAKKMLIRAFAGNVVAEVPDEGLRREIDSLVDEALDSENSDHAAL